MASLNGKWAMVSAENLEAYFAAFQTPEEFKAKMLRIPEKISQSPDSVVEEVSVNSSAGTVQLSVFVDGNKREDSGCLPIGKVVEKTGADGRPSKIEINVESETKLTMKKSVGDLESVSVVTLDGASNTMIWNATCNGITSVQKFRRL